MPIRHVFLIFLGLALVFPVLAYAACVEPYCTKVVRTVPFGGMVLTVKIPTVTCVTVDGGTAPVLLSTNIAAAGNTIITGATERSSLQRNFGMGVSIYRSIPLYTMQSLSKNGLKLQPKPGDWILGNQQIIPDVATCTTTIFGAPIPFPVVKTDNYGVSKPNSQFPGIRQ